MLQRFIIEREIPKVGTFDLRQLKEAAIKSNEALKQLGTDIQWVESYISEDKIFCVYLAASEDLIRGTPSGAAFQPTKSPRFAAGSTRPPRIPASGRFRSGTSRADFAAALTRRAPRL